MPALNEARTVGQVIQGIPSEIPGVDSIEVLVVDDGSSDETSAIAKDAGATVIRYSSPKGLGAAFQSALAHGIDSRADLIVTIDSDGQFNPAEIPKLIEPVISGRADFATASRFKDPALVPKMPTIKRWGNWFMSRWVSRLTGQTLHDVSCGFRCYGRFAALHLHLLGRFTYSQEVMLNLAFKEIRIAEVPVRVRGEREHGKSRLANNLWRYAFRTSRIIVRTFRDYMPLRFFGSIASVLFLAAGGLGLFFLARYFRTGSFSPHLWAGFTSAALAGLGFLMFHMGMIGDMLNRHRIYLEEILFRQRSERTWDGRSPGSGTEQLRPIGRAAQDEP